MCALCSCLGSEEDEATSDDEISSEDDTPTKKKPGTGKRYKILGFACGRFPQIKVSQLSFA